MANFFCKYFRSTPCFCSFFLNVRRHLLSLLINNSTLHLTGFNLDNSFSHDFADLAYFAMSSSAPRIFHCKIREIGERDVKVFGKFCVNSLGPWITTLLRSQLTAVVGVGGLQSDPPGRGRLGEFASAKLRHSQYLTKKYAGKMRLHFHFCNRCMKYPFCARVQI